MSIWKLYKKERTDESKMRVSENSRLKVYLETKNKPIFNHRQHRRSDEKKTNTHRTPNIHRKCSVLKSIHMQTAQCPSDMSLVMLFSFILVLWDSDCQSSSFTICTIFLYTKYFLTDFNFTFHWVTSNYSLMLRLESTLLPQF